MPSVRVSNKNMEKLNQLKNDGEYKSVDEVITLLLKIHTRYNEAEQVRLVRFVE